MTLIMSQLEDYSEVLPLMPVNFIWSKKLKSLG